MNCCKSIGKKLKRCVIKDLSCYIKGSVSVAKGGTVPKMYSCQNDDVENTCISVPCIESIYNLLVTCDY